MVCPGRPGRARYCFVQRLFAQSSDIAARCPSPGVGYPLGGNPCANRGVCRFSFTMIGGSPLTARLALHSW